MPVLVIVIILWYGIKHNLSTQRQNPLRRGVYEALYHELATSHSTLWTRRGPRQGIVPIGWWSSLKWRLLSSWFSDSKLKLTPNYDPAIEEFGAWSRTKRYLARRWLATLPTMPIETLPHTVSPGEHTPFALSPSTKELGAVGELLSIATPVAIAELDPTAASKLQQRVPIERLRSLSPTRSEGRSSGRGSSDGGDGGVMVEEKGVSEDERSGDEGGRGGTERREREREWEREEKRRKQKLSVPFQG